MCKAKHNLLTRYCSLAGCLNITGLIPEDERVSDVQSLLRADRLTSQHDCQIQKVSILDENGISSDSDVAVAVG